PVTQLWYPADRKARTLRLLAQREIFLAILDRLPPVLCHNDAHRLNLLLRKQPDGQYQTVALDWAFAGRGAPGADTSELVMTSIFFLEYDPAQLADLATSVLDGYVAGLHDTGWDGDVRLVRLGYLASVALGFAISMPGWTGFMLGEEQRANTIQQFDRSADEIARAWVVLWEYAHTCADQARALMQELGFSPV
ncbi:MAG TPA: phosphotransferase, partial [Roseiflexaceae bacterium]|nr:phosphotransferase [Roseiflexaceae bacterium]